MLHLKLDGSVFQLGDPISCSREIFPDKKQSQAFGLTPITTKPIQVGDFIGDTDRGGSCNVLNYTFTPHNLTHVETGAHVSKEGFTLRELPSSTFSGLAKLVNLAPKNLEKITYEYLPSLPLPYTILAVRTQLSDLDPHTDFTGTDPVHFDPNAVRQLVGNWPHLQILVTDLPSLDKEDDGGKLRAHRYLFEIGPEQPFRAAVELAYFKEVPPGDYYIVMTPPRIDTDAMIVDVVCYPVIK